MTERDRYEQIEKELDDLCPRLDKTRQEFEKLLEVIDHLDSDLQKLMEKKCIRFRTTEGQTGTITGQGDDLETVIVLMDNGTETQLNRKDIVLID